VETPGLWYLDLISVVVWTVKILIQLKFKTKKELFFLLTPFYRDQRIETAAVLAAGACWIVTFFSIG
jgi:hypothetical protein